MLGDKLTDGQFKEWSNETQFWAVPCAVLTSLSKSLEAWHGRGRQFENATLGGFSPPQKSAGTRRVQSPEAMAIEDKLGGPTKA